MNLDVLIADLRIDAGDETLGYYVCRRSLEKATAVLNADASTSFVITRGVGESATIDPDPAGANREALLLLAQMFLVEKDLVTSSNKVTSWKSGDKSVDRSRQLLTKENLAGSLYDLYRKMLGLDAVTMATPLAYEPVGSDSEGGGIELG